MGFFPPHAPLLLRSGARAKWDAAGVGARQRTGLRSLRHIWPGEIKSRKLWGVKRRDLHAAVEPSGSPRAHAASRCTAAQRLLLLPLTLAWAAAGGPLQGPRPRSLLSPPLLGSTSCRFPTLEKPQTGVETNFISGAGERISRCIGGGGEKKKPIVHCSIFFLITLQFEPKSVFIKGFPSPKYF